MTSTTVRVIGGGPFAKPLQAFEPVFCPPDHPRLAALRRRHRVLATAGEGDDFARARRLMHWVRSRWNHGYDHAQVDDDLDALKLLDAAKRGCRFSCGNYAQTFVQCCLAVGILARRLSLNRREADFPHGFEGNYGHSVSEAYCRELGKWVLLDCDLNGFYTLDGVPAGALDLHRSWHEHRGRNAEQVLDEPAFVPIIDHFEISRKQMRKNWRDFSRHRTIDYYCHVRVYRVNGYARRDRDAPANTLLEFSGIVHPLTAIGFAQREPADAYTADEAQFNFRVNRTYLQARMVGARPSRRVKLLLDHTMPQFDRFELSVGRDHFRRVRGDTKMLTVSVGRTTLRARCIDTFGRPGHEARLVVRAT